MMHRLRGAARSVQEHLSYPEDMSYVSRHRVPRHWRRSILRPSTVVAAIALISALVASYVVATAVHDPAIPGARLDSRLTATQTTSLGSGIAGTTLTVEPDEGSKPLVRLLNKAQTTIFVECYIVSDTPVVHALERAAAQGVQVYVLLEPHPFGMGSQPQRVSDQLQAAGVHVRWTSRVFALTHAKFIVTDDRIAVVSTANFSRSAFSQNREFLFADANPILVRQLSSIFRADWDRLPVNVVDPDAVVAPENARSTISRLITSAHSSVRIYAEELNDSAIERLLAALARRRVRVEIILAAGQSPAAARLLVRAGVSVSTMKSPYIHAKLTIVDGREAFAGSENISTQSLDANREVGVLLQGSVLRRLITVFMGDWRRASPVHA
jgi:cardiolipin synthase A/B